MSKLFQQLGSVVKASVDTLFAPAQDPRQTYSDPWQRQQELLGRVREALAQNTSLRNRLEQRMTHLQSKLPQLAETARRAVAAGRDDLARLALQQRQLALLELKSLEANAQEVRLEEQRIGIIEQRLSAQVEAMRVRQEMSTARYTAAESQAMMQEVIHGFSKELTDLGQTIELTERKTEHLQARASAMEEFVNVSLDFSSGADYDPISGQFAQLDIDRAVAEQLAALKQQSKVRAKDE